MSKYNVGDKFVIEIDEIFRNDEDDIIHEEKIYRIKGFRSLVFDDNGLDKLNQAITPAEDGLVDKSKVEEIYIKALNDAWKLYNIALTMPRNELCKILNIEPCSLAELIESISPQEALAKLEAYEKEQNEIKVGDVVTIFPRSGGQYDAIVVLTKSQGYIDAIYSDGVTTSNVPPELYKKTSKHIDIQSVLQQIGE